MSYKLFSFLSLVVVNLIQATDGVSSAYREQENSECVTETYRGKRHALVFQRGCTENPEYMDECRQHYGAVLNSITSPMVRAQIRVAVDGTYLRLQSISPEIGPNTASLETRVCNGHIAQAAGFFQAMARAYHLEIRKRERSLNSSEDCSGSDESIYEERHIAFK